MEVVSANISWLVSLFHLQTGSHPDNSLRSLPSSASLNVMSKIEIPDETKHNTPVTLQSHMNSEEKGSGSLTASISSPRDEQSEDECISYPSPGRLSLILLGLAFSIFLTGLVSCVTRYCDIPSSLF